MSIFKIVNTLLNIYIYIYIYIYDDDYNKVCECCLSYMIHLYICDQPLQGVGVGNGMVKPMDNANGENGACGCMHYTI